MSVTNETAVCVIDAIDRVHGLILEMRRDVRELRCELKTAIELLQDEVRDLKPKHERSNFGLEYRL